MVYRRRRECDECLRGALELTPVDRLCTETGMEETWLLCNECLLWAEKYSDWYPIVRDKGTRESK